MGNSSEGESSARKCSCKQLATLPSSSECFWQSEHISRWLWTSARSMEFSSPSRYARSVPSETQVITPPLDRRFHDTVLQTRPPHEPAAPPPPLLQFRAVLPIPVNNARSRA